VPGVERLLPPGGPAVIEAIEIPGHPLAAPPFGPAAPVYGPIAPADLPPPPLK
jgi:hypothetical protein